MKTREKIGRTLKHPELAAQLLLLAALLASCCFIFRSYLFGDEIMVFDDIGGDTWQQYTAQYASIINHLRSGNFSLWDFTNGFGTNICSLNLLDPSLVLLYLIGVLLGPARMMLYISYVQVLKILAAGWIFYLFLSEFRFSRQTKLISAYLYGLNGFLLVWGQHYQFGMAAVYLPLMLLFAERFLCRKKGRAFFPVSVFLCGLYSVYFSYMSLICVGFYLLFRVWMMDGWKIKERVGRFLAGCGQILLGIAMSAAMFLPSVSVMLNVSTRISGEGEGIVYWLKNLFTFYRKEYYSMLMMRLFSSHLENADFLMDGEPSFWNYYEAPVLFCCTLTVFLVMQFWLVYWKSNAQRRAKAAVYTASVIMVLCVLMPWGGSMFNAFVAPSHRYTFVLFPFMLLAAAWMWDDLKKRGRINWPGLVLTALFMLLVMYIGYTHSELTIYRVNAVVLAVTGVVGASVIGLLSVLKTQRWRRAVQVLVLFALAVNVLSESNAAYEARITLRKTDTPSELTASLKEEYQALAEKYGERKVRELMDRPQEYFRETYIGGVQDAINYVESTDPELCRIEKDYHAGTLVMDSLLQGYRGISTYNSVMNGNIREFVDTCFPKLHYLNENHYAFWPNAEDNWMASFFGIRYLISRAGELDSSKYTLLQDYGGIYLYKNNLESGMARFYDTAISEESLKELCSEESRRTLLDNAVAVEGGADIKSTAEFMELKAASVSDNTGASSVTLDYTENDSHITGRIQADSDGYVMFLIPYEKGWSLTIDGEETELVRGDLGFLACQVTEGTHELVLNFQAPLLKEGIFVSAAAWILFIILLLWGYRKKQGRASLLFRMTGNPFGLSCDIQDFTIFTIQRIRRRNRSAPTPPMT